MSERYEEEGFDFEGEDQSLARRMIAQQKTLLKEVTGNRQKSSKLEDGIARIGLQKSAKVNVNSPKLQKLQLDYKTANARQAKQGIARNRQQEQQKTDSQHYGNQANPNQTRSGSSKEKASNINYAGLGPAQSLKSLSNKGSSRDNILQSYRNSAKSIEFTKQSDSNKNPLSRHNSLPKRIIIVPVGRVLMNSIPSMEQGQLASLDSDKLNRLNNRIRQCIGKLKGQIDSKIADLTEQKLAKRNNRPIKNASEIAKEIERAVCLLRQEVRNNSSRIIIIDKQRQKLFSKEGKVKEEEIELHLERETQQLVAKIKRVSQEMTQIQYGIKCQGNRLHHQDKDGSSKQRENVKAQLIKQRKMQDRNSKRQSQVCRQLTELTQKHLSMDLLLQRVVQSALEMNIPVSKPQVDRSAQLQKLNKKIGEYRVNNEKLARCFAKHARRLNTEVIGARQDLDGLNCSIENLQQKILAVKLAERSLRGHTLANVAIKTKQQHSKQAHPAAEPSPVDFRLLVSQQPSGFIIARDKLSSLGKREPTIKQQIVLSSDKKMAFRQQEAGVQKDRTPTAGFLESVVASKQLQKNPTYHNIWKEDSQDQQQLSQKFSPEQHGPNKQGNRGQPPITGAQQQHPAVCGDLLNVKQPSWEEQKASISPAHTLKAVPAKQQKEQGSQARQKELKTTEQPVVTSGKTPYSLKNHTIKVLNRQQVQEAVRKTKAQFAEKQQGKKEGLALGGEIGQARTVRTPEELEIKADYSKINLSHIQISAEEEPNVATPKFQQLQALKKLEARPQNGFGIQSPQNDEKEEEQENFGSLQQQYSQDNQFLL